MTDRQIRNLLVYCGIAVADMLVVAIAAALAAGAMPGFREGELMAPAAPILAAVLAVLTPILTTALASTRPRFGSEELAHDVDQARAAGVSRKRLTVRAKRGGEPMTEAQTQQVADELERRMRTTPAREDAP